MRHQRRNPLTLGAVELLDANSRRACDSLDGLADGVIGDLFGTHHVGGIHGRLLTAWSVAGVLGTLAITTLRQHALRGGSTACRKLPSQHSEPGDLWPSNPVDLAVYASLRPKTHEYGQKKARLRPKHMNTAKKMAVLEGLRAQSEPLSLPELLALLPSGFAERSVRRWLSELEDEGQVAKTGRRRGTRYRALADSSPESPAAGQDSATDPAPGTLEPMRFSQTAQAAGAYVSQPLFQRAPVAYDADWLAAYEPNRTVYFPARRSAELAEQGRRAPVGDPAGTYYARRIYNRLLIDLSHHSSRLEGNTTRCLIRNSCFWRGVRQTASWTWSG